MDRYDTGFASSGPPAAKRGEMLDVAAKVTVQSKSSGSLRNSLCSLFLLSLAPVLMPNQAFTETSFTNNAYEAAVAIALAESGATNLARPSPEQIAWADLELEMFLCLDPCTWQGEEYDNGKTPLEQIVLPKLDTDQWCEAAKAFGAKQIIHVLKHTGFCWWQTDTTPYSIKKTRVQDGQADLGLQLSSSCRKFGLKYGTYMSAADRWWGAPVGSGGKTSDPAKQGAYNDAYRQQMREVLTRFGEVSEIWFDGGCKIPVEDIIRKSAPKALVFGGPFATLRWPGTESGKLPYPCWSSIREGVNSDGEGVGDPDGTRWCPPECDTVLYGHGGHSWFWSTQNETRRHTLSELMDIYLGSVGRGGVLLLNATPNTDGLIPEGDMQMYREFGAELARRFGHPLAHSSGVGDTISLDLGRTREVNQCWVMEDLRGGHRIRAYVVEGCGPDGQWRVLARGSSVGHKRIELFRKVAVDRLRLRVTERKGTPIIREFASFYVEGVEEEENTSLTAGRKATASSSGWKNCAVWDSPVTKLALDLTSHVKEPGTYEICFRPRTGSLRIRSVRLFFNGFEMPKTDCTLKEEMLVIRQTQQVTAQTRTEVIVEIESPVAGEAEVRIVEPRL